MGALSLNLLDQLAFYGAYHSNKWNQLIHFVFVPSILWSLGVWLAALGPLAPTPAPAAALAARLLPPWLAGAAVFNVPAAALAAYSAYYSALDPLAGASWAACVALPVWLTATAFQQQALHAARWAAAVQVFSWYMQVHPGHLLLEGRKPALMDSLAQALTLAPLFVWFELLFLLGYRRGLHAQLKARVAADVAAWRRQH